MGQQERLRDVSIVLREGVLHLEHILGEVILSGERVHAWEMVDLLMRLHLTQHLHADCRINPLDIPVLRLFLAGDVVVQLQADLLDHIILGVY